MGSLILLGDGGGHSTIAIQRVSATGAGEGAWVHVYGSKTEGSGDLLKPSVWSGQVNAKIVPPPLPFWTVGQELSCRGSILDWWFELERDFFSLA